MSIPWDRNLRQLQLARGFHHWLPVTMAPRLRCIKWSEPVHACKVRTLSTLRHSTQILMSHRLEKWYGTTLIVGRFWTWGSSAKDREQTNIHVCFKLSRTTYQNECNTTPSWVHSDTGRWPIPIHVGSDSFNERSEHCYKVATTFSSFCFPQTALSVSPSGHISRLKVLDLDVGVVLCRRNRFVLLRWGAQ